MITRHVSCLPTQRTGALRAVDGLPEKGDCFANLPTRNNIHKPSGKIQQNMNLLHCEKPRRAPTAPRCRRPLTKETSPISRHTRGESYEPKSKSKSVT